MTSWTDQTQFNRKVRVIVASSVLSNRTSVIPPTAITFYTRTAFQVTKTSDPKPDTAKISIYNLNKESKGFLGQQKNWIWLQVGYGQTISFTPWQTLFFGDLVFLKTVKRGGDIITDMECQDGGEILKTTIVSLSLAPGCTNLQVLAQVIRQLNVTLASPITLPPIPMKWGYTECKTASSILDDLTKRVDFQWKIQDGQLSLWSTVLPPPPNEVVVLNPDTGLLGVPSRIEKTAEASMAGVKAVSKLLPGPHLDGRCLINAKIRPKSLVEVSWSEVLFLMAQIERAEFTGDSQEGPFECHFQGKILATKEKPPKVLPPTITSDMVA